MSVLFKILVLFINKEEMMTSDDLDKSCHCEPPLSQTGWIQEKGNKMANSVNIVILIEINIHSRNSKIFNFVSLYFSCLVIYVKGALI